MLNFDVSVGNISLGAKLFRHKDESLLEHEWTAEGCHVLLSK